MVSESIESNLDDINLAEPARASIARQAKANLPLLLPWHPSETIKPGALFRSRLCETDDPWAKNTPFKPSSLASIPLLFHNDDGGAASFKSHISRLAVSDTEHMSVSMGVSIGCPILGASVTGRYDKEVSENKDQSKSSIRSTYRSGTVLLLEAPRLSTEALITIKYNGGIPAFKERYGDYYVAGYRLGGDTGILISQAASSSMTSEHLSVEVKVKVLFVTISHSWNTDSSSSSASQSVRVIGYDTLTDTHVSGVASGGPGTAELGASAQELVAMAQGLGLRVDGKLAEMGLREEEPLEYATCDRLTREGLVAELILLPITTMRQVLEWSTSDDII